MTQLTGFKMIRNLLEGNSEQALMLQFQFYFAIILLSTAQKFTDFHLQILLVNVTKSL